MLCCKPRPRLNTFLGLTSRRATAASAWGTLAKRCCCGLLLSPGVILPDHDDIAFVNIRTHHFGDPAVG